jgi:MFS family permease
LAAGGVTPREDRVADVLVALGCFFFLANLMQSAVSLRANDLHVRGLELGVALALCSGGLGIVTDIGFAAFADARGRGKLVACGFGGALCSAALLFFDRSVLLLWVAAVLFGFSGSAMGNSLLALLSGRATDWRQARLQGINGSVQRLGALVGAGIVGISLASHSVEGLAGALVAGAALGLVAVLADVRSTATTERAVPARRLRGMVGDGYVRGLKMLRQRRIVVASLINIGLNVVFLETNSFIPLLHGHGASAIVVSGAIAARDVFAVTCGLIIAYGSYDVSAGVVVVAVLADAALAALGMGLSVHFALTGLVVLLSALQGVAVGVGIAATNLYTISATADEDRSVGMAASILGTRAALIAVPLIAGAVLSAGGLDVVFYFFAAVLGLLGVAVAAVLATGRNVPLRLLEAATGTD